MGIIRNISALAATIVLSAPVMASADTYSSANFSGAIYPGNANVQSPFSGNGFNQGDTLSGNFVYDNQQVPGGGSGYQNVQMNGFPDAATIPPGTAFTLTLDSLSFNLADNIDALLPAQIQYNNGQFNGFVFTSDFQFQGAYYQFGLQGTSFTVYALDGISNSYDMHGNPTGNRLIGGYINLGNANLTGVSAYTPPPPVVAGAPEPATWALTVVAVGGIGASLRSRRRTTRTA